MQCRSKIISNLNFIFSDKSQTFKLCFDSGILKMKFPPRCRLHLVSDFQLLVRGKSSLTSPSLISPGMSPAPLINTLRGSSYLDIRDIESIIAVPNVLKAYVLSEQVQDGADFGLMAGRLVC
jgi:hypothetical protein